MALDNDLPVYDWEAAQVGHARKTVRTEIDPKRIALYVSSSGDPNPMFTDRDLALSKGFPDGAVPVAMATRVAPHNRRSIMLQNGHEHTLRPTPFARWQCRFFAPLRPGDVITSNARVADKFEKRGRKYLVWEVTATNQNGEKVLEWRTTNCWDLGKPEDRLR